MSQANGVATAQDLIDQEAIVRALKSILAPGQVTELRAFDVVLAGSNYVHKTVSGYFDNVEKLAEAAATIRQAAGVYFIPNRVKPELLARAVNKIRPISKEPTTSDQQITRRLWFLVDCDAQRPSGISASNEERERALLRAIDIDEYLSRQGWPEGIRADSGNGGHLAYAIDEPADDDGLIKSCLEALADMFNDEQVKVDVTVFNPARIWRLYGALNGKGDVQAAELGRAHRRAKTLQVPDEMLRVPNAKLRALAALAPMPTPPPSHRHASNGNGKPWDMEGFISRFGLRTQPAANYKNGTKWVFEECPFNSEHTAPDAALFLGADGKPGFKCFHNSCSPNHWEQLREKIDPGCYARRNDNQSQHSKSASQANEQSPIPMPLSFGELSRGFPKLREPVIKGLLRTGETANLISTSKMGKSWLSYGISLSVVTGKKIWGRFTPTPGNVLIIDNELHKETIAYRIPKVAEQLGISPAEYEGKLFVESLRGRRQDINKLASYFLQFERGQYQLIIIDALYRALPKGTDENDNGAVAEIYNQIDYYADQLGCAFMLVHHASKGNQASKSVTDVGAGAGSLSRAADTHLILRPHQVAGAVVVDAAVRSWEPIEPFCMRWDFPVWSADDSLDPKDLKNEKAKRPETSADSASRPPPMTTSAFVAKFVTAEAVAKLAIIDIAIEAGVPKGIAEGRTDASLEGRDARSD